MNDQIELANSIEPALSCKPEHLKLVGPDFLQITWDPTKLFPGRNQPVLSYRTLSFYDMWQSCVKTYSERPCFGYRLIETEGTKQKLSDFQWISYSESGLIVDQIGSAISTKFGVGKDNNIGIYSINRPEWLLCDLAIHRQGAVSVPLYSTFGIESLVYIINHADLRVIFCEKGVLPNIIANISQLVCLKVVICFDAFSLTDEQAQCLKKSGVEIVLWADLLPYGEKNPQQIVPVQNTDAFSLIYTSGTTGSPKGVIITHRNVLACTEIIHNSGCFPNGVHNQVHYSYLPLAHVYERDVSISMLRSGGQIGFISGSMSNLLDDIKTLKPTLLIGVPRVFKKIYDKVTETVNKLGFLQRNLFQTALNSKLNAKQNNTTTWINWDSLVFHKFQDMLGGRCKFILSGAAPFDPVLVPWFESVFLVDFFQAYGLTETFGGISVNSLSFPGPYSSIGMVLNLTQWRLKDVPEMNYFHTDNPPRGEVILRGESIFAGYYKNKEATDEVLSADGWFSTGDIAQLDPNGQSLTIIDRKKNIFKLAQGEYIAAEKLENVYGRTFGVAQIWVFGESGDNFIVAVVVIDMESFPQIAKGLGLSENISNNDIISSKVVYDYYMDALTKTGKEAKLCGFEMLKGLIIETEQFSVENNLLTPSLKIIRTNLKPKYIDRLKRLRKHVQREMKANEKGLQ